MSQIINGFEPIVDSNCTMLILGSIPSKLSRANGFYYGNPTNRFWKALSYVFDTDFVSQDNYGKTKLLLSNDIALSDVYCKCVMKKQDSSSDGDITSVEFTNVPLIIDGTKIDSIYITSKRAYNDFVKHFADYLLQNNITVTYLPSPSSANKSVYKTADDLAKRWQQIIKRR